MRITKLLNRKILEPWLLYKLCNLSFKDWNRLRRLPRYHGGVVKLWGRKIEFVDANTVLGGLREIFLDKCFKFVTDEKNPIILDCGSNIGFSIIYFKFLYPYSKIIAFEADPLIYKVLCKNIESFNFSDVIIHNRAVWDSEETLEFRVEGGMSGRVRIDNESGEIFQVKGIPLKSFLDRKIDLLKIDIEGAEYKVIKDCALSLTQINKIFLEYHSPKSHPQTLSSILAILENSGFRNFIKEAYVPDYPFEKITDLDGMDLQLNIYATKG